LHIQKICIALSEKEIAVIAFQIKVSQAQFHRRLLEAYSAVKTAAGAPGTHNNLKRYERNLNASSS